MKIPESLPWKADGCVIVASVEDEDGAPDEGRVTVVSGDVFGIDEDCEHAAYIVQAANLFPELVAALRKIVAEPHGCRFCDSGTLRNAATGHDYDCGYLLADAAIAKAEA